MYYNDHAPPHFHACYSEHEVEVLLESLDVLRGSLPQPRLSLVLEWASQHRMELMDNWHAARRGEPLSRIRGLE